MAQLRTVEATEDLRTVVHDLAVEAHDSLRCSMYVDLDPRQFATAPARKSAITSALDSARRRAPDPGWNDVLDDLAEQFAANSYSIDGARGLLVFTDLAGDATLVKLPTPVQSTVTFSRIVPVRPIIESLPMTRWCVLLCNRRSTRVLMGDVHGLEQVIAYDDDVEGQHAKGGWAGLSQSRYERTIEGQVLQHVRDTARTVRELHDAGMFARLLVVAPRQLRALLDKELDNGVRDAFCGFVDADVAHSTRAEVEAKVLPRIAAIEDDARDSLLDRLQQQLGRHERSVAGLDGVLGAVREGRVATLIVAEGFAHPGWACRHGDWLSTATEPCPVHGGGAVEPVADIVELAVECSIARDAHVTTIPRTAQSGWFGASGDDGSLDQELDGAVRPARESEHPRFRRLTSLGSIAALLRFDLAPSSASNSQAT